MMFTQTYKDFAVSPFIRRPKNPLRSPALTQRQIHRNHGELATITARLLAVFESPWPVDVEPLQVGVTPSVFEEV